MKLPRTTDRPRARIHAPASFHPRPSSILLLALNWLTVLAMPGLFSGCRLAQSAAEMPGKAVGAFVPGKSGGIDPVQVQQRLFRITDEFTVRITVSLERIEPGTNGLTQSDLLRTKLGLVSDTCAIVSGPNPMANLLDFTIFVTLLRQAVEDYAIPRFGQVAEPMLEICRDSESNVWRLATSVLKPQQAEELRNAVRQWYQRHPRLEGVMGIRAVEVVTQFEQANAAPAASTESVFSLLRLDPLAGLDPAARELAQTRMFAERALFVSQKLPKLLRWQTELLLHDITGVPIIRQLSTNTAEISDSLGRFAGVAERLPEQISEERRQILSALESQEKELSPLLSEMHETLVAGLQMSTSLNTTLTTFDGLMKRFGVGESNSIARTTNAEPFRIRDYAQTAAQLERTAQQLTELLVTLDRTVGSTNFAELASHVSPVMDRAQSGGEELVDYVFWRCVMLMGVIVVIAFGYRVVMNRLSTRQPNSES